MGRKYYTLAIREDGKWSPQFGDFEKQVVVDEDRDSYSEEYKRQNRKIITTGPKQDDINVAIFKMNCNQ